MSNISCFGEVLWDIFPTHKSIGGAPLNVALRLSSFGNDVTLISSVGADSNGLEIIKILKLNSINIDQIQITKEFKTSEVHVILDKKGSATYHIETPCAWDNIMVTGKLKKNVATTDAFVFGSLANRNLVSKKTLMTLLEIAKFKIFDVNLRPPYYSMDVLIDLMIKSDFIKFNDDELIEICSHYKFQSNNFESCIKFISKQTNTQSICVTRGKNGTILFLNNEFFENHEYPITVKNTVGAGDSFLASLVSKLLEKTNPQEALDFACAVGAIVASNDEANPKIEEKDLLKFIIK